MRPSIRGVTNLSDRHDKKIILYPNANRDIGFAFSQKVGELLTQCGRRVALCPVFEDAQNIQDAIEKKAPASGFESNDFEVELPNAEMIITFGGDGTILRAARAASEYGIPILGVNMGGKGFMAEVETDEIELLKNAATGAFEIESRMMLDAEVIREGISVHKDFALNDIVIRGYNKVIDLTLYGDGQIISGYAGDGAVIATPTGSTAYSMSAGGPIVEPTAHNIIVTPICAHLLDAKPFVLVSERRVTIDIGHEKHNPAYISADGCDRVDIFSGDMVNISKSLRYTHLVRLSGRSFYSKVSEKLRER